MTDLRVDYQLLDHIYAGLGRLAGQFEHIQAMQDGYNEAMGSAAVAGQRRTLRLPPGRLRHQRAGRR
jgi:hypothetical protein